MTHIISQAWKPPFQSIFWLEFLPIVKSWITDRQLCLLFSRFWACILLESFHFVASRSHRWWPCQSCQPSQRLARETGERGLSSRGALTLLTPDSGAQLEKSQVIISMIFSGSRIIPSRKSARWVYISSKTVNTVVGTEKVPSIHSPNLCCTPTKCQAVVPALVTLQETRRQCPCSRGSLGELGNKWLRNNHASNNDKHYKKNKTIVWKRMTGDEIVLFK